MLPHPPYLGARAISRSQPADVRAERAPRVRGVHEGPRARSACTSPTFVRCASSPGTACATLRVLVVCPSCKYSRDFGAPNSSQALQTPQLPSGSAERTPEHAQLSSPRTRECAGACGRAGGHEGHRRCTPLRETTRPPSTCGCPPRVRSGLPPREDRASNLVGGARDVIGLEGGAGCSGR